MPELPEFKPEDFPDKKCCGIFEYMILNGFKYPFYLTVSQALMQSLNPVPSTWAVRLYKQTARSLTLNEREQISLTMAYCPFCGAKLNE